MGPSWDECIEEATDWANAMAKPLTDTDSCARAATAWVSIANALVLRPDTEEPVPALAADTYRRERDEARESWRASEARSAEYQRERNEARRQLDEHQCSEVDVAAEHARALDAVTHALEQWIKNEVRSHIELGHEDYRDDCGNVLTTKDVQRCIESARGELRGR